MNKEIASKLDSKQAWKAAKMTERTTRMKERTQRRKNRQDYLADKARTMRRTKMVQSVARNMASAISAVAASKASQAKQINQQIGMYSIDNGTNDRGTPQTTGPNNNQSIDTTIRM